MGRRTESRTLYENIGVITHMDNKWTENSAVWRFNEEDPIVKELVDKGRRSGKWTTRWH